ncbi:peptidase M61 [Sphingomonas sp. dw_22]|uniref:M61 family metallopeptidase n=1 Tax=Sphingomonas sp. dw_22 TaxID=2721175 RepID=UPI001BD4AD6B|nr:peptidase M61 [Sphingomonas sp. dw_22]
MTALSRRAAKFVLAAALLPLPGGTAWAASDPAPELAITIAPAAPDAAHVIPYIDVTIVAQDVHRIAGEELFRLALVANTVVTSAKDLQGLTIADGKGAITPQTSDVEKDGSSRTRVWQASRAIDGPVTVRYRVPIDAAAPPLALPQYEMRTEKDSFSAAANAFVLLPADGKARRAHVYWDFTNYGAGGVGVSSFGVGDVASSEALSSDRFGSVYYMAGRPGVYRSGEDGFFAAWQGTPPFAMDPLMRWAADLHRFYGRFFGYTPPSFGVFGRTNARNPGSGIGLTDSFAFTFNHTSNPSDLRSLLAHEMLHSWVRSLDESMDAAGGLDRSWFGEGLAVHYQRLLPYRAGMISADAFLQDLNSTAGRYYTNIKIGVPNAEIPAGFWRDTRIRVLPYDRGSLYFASVDAQVRAASGGKRSLDDMVRAMLAARTAGKPMNEALWRSLLKAELGDKGVADLDAMLAGGTVVPPSDAFGPEFRRTTKMLRRFELGFDPASLLARPKIVRGLIAGSNAEKAGLRDGDEILNTFSQDGLQGKQDAYLALEVKRGAQTLSVRYQPRGEAVQSFQWERSSVPSPTAK